MTCVDALSMVNKVVFTSVLSGSYAIAARYDGDRRLVLMLSHWQMLPNTLRSVMILPLKSSITIEISELC